MEMKRELGERVIDPLMDIGIEIEMQIETGTKLEMEDIMMDTGVEI